MAYLQLGLVLFLEGNINPTLLRKSKRNSKPKIVAIADGNGFITRAYQRIILLSDLSSVIGRRLLFESLEFLK